MSAPLHGMEDAIKAVLAHQSPRARCMAQLERFVEGKQYEGRLSFWDDSKPLQERAPCIVYLLTANAIRSNADLVLGEGRFPAITCRPEEAADDDDDEGESAGEGGEGDPEQGELSDDDATALDKAITALVRSSRLRVAAREVFEAGQGTGSGCVILCLRNGRPAFDSVKAWWCEPELDADGSVRRLVIEYPYVETYKDQDGAWKVRARLYRREIDEAKDVTYKPADITASPSAKINWQIQESIDHGLGFCPVLWYPFMRGCSVVGSVDGHALHEMLTDEIEALDFALSQRHRAALYAGDPQWTEAGVQPGFNPSDAGRAAAVPSTLHGGPMSSANPVTGHWIEPKASGEGGKRRKGPGQVWQYPNADTKITLHSLPAGALDAVSSNARDLRLKICESLAYVPLDPDDLEGYHAVSGKALTALRKRQLERCALYREDLGDGFLTPAVSMLLRVAAVKGAGMRVRGIAKAMPILATMNTPEVRDAVAAA